ncbi:hypothetical protein COB55_02380 [Candidatus Wolfebacteria bacterium]|nr:MAG: hypothetical protein COB55_02380 [Candidatus Wolfebacteria bacterium]
MNTTEQSTIFEEIEAVLQSSECVARNLKHNFIGTEHVLLAILDNESLLAFRILKHLGIQGKGAKAGIRRMIGTGSSDLTDTKIQLTPRMKKVISLTRKEMRTLGDEKANTQHLLLGLLREGDGVAAKYLKLQGIGTDEIHRIIKVGVGSYDPCKKSYKRSWHRIVFENKNIATDEMVALRIVEELGISAQVKSWREETDVRFQFPPDIKFSLQVIQVELS